MVRQFVGTISPKVWTVSVNTFWGAPRDAIFEYCKKNQVCWLSALVGTKLWATNVDTVARWHSHLQKSSSCDGWGRSLWYREHLEMRLPPTMAAGSARAPTREGARWPAIDLQQHTFIITARWCHYDWVCFSEYTGNEIPVFRMFPGYSGNWDYVCVCVTYMVPRWP